MWDDFWESVDQGLTDFGGFVVEIQQVYIVRYMMNL